MIKNVLQKKIEQSNDRDLGHIKVYVWMSIILIPIMLLFLVAETILELQINPFHKSLIIYTTVMLGVFMGLKRWKLFRQNFLFAHYAFLFGVMFINLLWQFSDPHGMLPNVSLVLAANLIGFSLMNPRITIVFFTLTLISFLSVNGFQNTLYPEIGLMLTVTAIVISGFNNWRFHLNQNLKSSRETFKGIFDHSDQQIYVLSNEFEILDLSLAAEIYLSNQGVDTQSSHLFNDLFIPESKDCMNEFKKAIQKANELGNASFNATCAIAGTEEFIPKEFNIRRGKYFNQDVFILNVRIVKDQKDLEKELVAHKDNVTQILENISYFVFNIRFDASERYKHHVNFVSAKVQDVYGYSVDEYIALVKAERIDKDRHPDDREAVNEKFTSLMEKGGKDSWRFRMKVKGKWRWIEEKMFIEKLPETDSVSLFGMVKDVTEEIESEQLIVESEKRYRQIFETNLAGVFKTTISGELIDCNIAFAKILGYDSVAELKKISVKDIYFSQIDRSIYLEDLKKHKQLNNYPVKLKRKDGRRLIVHNNVSIQKDEAGEENIIIGTLIDVTELHETSLALQHSEEKYRMLFEESNSAILLVVISKEGSFVVDANQRSTELFGRDQNELVALRLEEMLFEAETAALELKEIEDVLSRGERTEKELRFVRKDGQSFHAEVSFASVIMDEEKVAQLVIKDISERKQYEKEILESRLSFKNIVDKSPASILIFTELGELAYVNPNGEDLFLNVLNSKDRNLYRVFPEEKHQLINDLIREAQNDINSYTEIELGEGESAKRYSINVVNTVYNFEKSNLFLLQDITLQTEYNIQKLRAEMAEETNASMQEEIQRHKRTQLSLMESTSRLKALFEGAAHLYIVSIDKEFNLVAYNENFKKMVWDLLEIDVEIGMNFLEIFPIEDYAYEIIINRFNKVLGGEPSNLVSKFKSVKGEVWMESFLSPILIDGQDVNEISFISHNITEQIQNRRRILESEENNKAILLAIPDILFKANNKGVFTDYRATSESNRKAFERFTKSNKIQGQKIKDVLVDQDLVKEIETFVDRALRQDQLFTHNFSVTLEGDSSEKVHYENRYSKVNDEEVVIISRNVTDTIEYEDKLIESVKEKEVLLKEVHHRVKNNLQVINSILNLQSSYVKDDETLQIIIESQNRIRSMSYIHESLYQTKDFSSINFQDYITNLIQNLVHSYEVYSEQTELDLKVDSVNLALDQAIPCGLILNELITNALKYAYPDKEGGKITIQVYEEKGKVFIRVQDFGVGLPEDFNISETDTLGLSLVDTLIDQLDGELILKSQKGTEFLIIFEKQEI